MRVTSSAHAWGLAAGGIVVLRCDKRTFTDPKLFDVRHATVEQEVVADAVLPAGRDELEAAQKLGAPILYLRGEHDRNVLAVDGERWAHALEPHGQLESATLPGLNHLLLPANSDLAGDVHVPPEVVARVADFIVRTRKMP